MQISNDFSWKSRMIKRENSALLPDNIRGLIIGKSNCGKTTLLLNLLLQPNWLDYNHLYVFGNTLHQQEYQIMKKGFDFGLSKQQIENVFRNQKKIDKLQASPLEINEDYNGEKKGTIIKADFFSDCTLIPDPAELNPDHKNLLILDDCFLGPQNKAEAYYTRGRQNNCDTFYISQSYFRLPRHTVRENANLIILFPQDAKNLQHIYADHCDGDMTLGEFKTFCRKVWSMDHQFVVLDLTSEKTKGKYRKNLDTFYFPTINETFLQIKDPQKRDEIVQDYLASLVVTKKNGDIQQQHKDNLIFQEHLEDDGKYQMENVLKTHIGKGIQFLPGDINGLRIKLDYLIAEYRAGNTSATRNEIVAIIDELLRRKQLSPEKYNNINNFIQQG